MDLRQHKIKNSDRIVFINEPINHHSYCYDFNDKKEFNLIKNEKISLINGIVINIDHNGKIYEYWENHDKCDILGNIGKYETEEIHKLIKSLLDEIEIRSRSKIYINNINNENVENSKKENKLNILVTSICFVNRNKEGAEIYATFANRLLNDVMTKTSFDYRIITNETYHFEESKLLWGDRVIITEDKLENDKITVGPFNQLLKYKTMIGVDDKYDWILYLDCDAGFTGELDEDSINKQTEEWVNLGYDFLAARTNAILKNELLDHENKEKEFLEKTPNQEYNPWVHGGNLFSSKFIFYNVSSENGPFEWMDAKLPSEHVWYIKNNEKLEKLGQTFKEFNEVFQKQDPNKLITWDMEAFEVGVSAKLAGYNMGDLGNDGQFHIFKIGFNFNNWEKVKY